MLVASLARWSARLAAAAITVLFILFLVGEGTPDLRELSDQELGQFAALAVIVAGALVAWRRELAGALLILGGYAAFAWLEHGWPPLPFTVYLLAGLLLLLSAALRRFRPRPPADPVAPPPDTP